MRKMRAAPECRQLLLLGAGSGRDGSGGWDGLIGILTSGNSVIGHITKRSPVAELVEQVD